MVAWQKIILVNKSTTKVQVTFKFLKNFLLDLNCLKNYFKKRNSVYFTLSMNSMI